MADKPKLIRITTVASSMSVLLKGQLRFMGGHFDVLGITTKDNVYSKKIIEQEKIKLYDVKISRNISPLIDLVSLYKIFKIIKKEKPSIVHTHTPKAGLLGMLAAYTARTPIRLHTYAGMPKYSTTSIKGKLLILFEKITFMLATKIYPNSYGLKEYIVNKNIITENKLKVIGKGSSNGIDLEYFNPELISKDQKDLLRKKLKITENNIVISFAGRIVRDKGIRELIDSFVKYKIENQNIKLLLIGPSRKDDDPLEDSYQEIIKNNSSIILTGLVEDVRPYLMLSTIFVFPSYREGLPNSLLQACSLRLPCIATDIAGNNEIIINNINGLLIPPKNKLKLYEAIKYMCENKVMQDEFSNVTRNIINEKYNQKYVWDELLCEYKNIIKKHKIF